MSYIELLDKQQRTRRYINIKFIFLSFDSNVCESRNTVRESLHISFFCGGEPLCVLEQWPENTHEELTGLLEWSAGLSLCLRGQRTSPLRLSDYWISAFSPKLQTLYSLSSPNRKYEHPLCLMYFLFMAGYRNLHTSVFFQVICWSYLQTEISDTLSIGNKLY